MSRRKNEDIRLFADGNILNSKMYEFELKKSFEMKEYFVMEYTCWGIRRQLLKREFFIFAQMENEETALICYDDILIDHKRHSVIVRTKEGMCRGLHIRFAIDRRRSAEFTIHQMYSCSQKDLPTACERLETKECMEFEMIDLTRYYNGRYSQDTSGCMIDGGSFFDKDLVYLRRIPFRISMDECNMIIPPPPPAENDDIIMNFGVLSRRRLCRPVSRNGMVEVPVNSLVKELFFIMAINGTRHQRWGFATDGTILGNPDGEVTMPLTVTDTEGFMVEIVYENGNRDTAFPFNLSLERHAVQGDVGVYAVPADGSMVERVIFHNRLLDNDCSLIAVTVNADKERLYPELLIPQKPKELLHSCPKKKTVSLKDYILELKNGAVAMKIDLADGFKLLEMTNAYTPACSCLKERLLKLKEEQEEIISGIILQDVMIEDNSVVVSYRLKELLSLTITIFLTGTDDIKFGLRIRNLSTETVRIGTVFPYIEGLTYAGSEDSWYFFPKYQNIDSNETVFIYEESAPSFPMQFLDTYSPSQQGGLSLTTQEQGLTVRKYGLEKKEGRITFYVEYPFMYGELQPGQTLETSPTLLTAHSGDWRKAYWLYKEWLETWYEPYKCQDKQWYRECFWLLAEITDFFETDEFTKLPVWYDKGKKEFQFKRILEEQKEITGYYPDILHLWAWTYSKENAGVQQWGNFGDVDYDLYDGMKNFRSALHEVMDEKKVKISLYLHPTLLSGGYSKAEKFFPEHRVINESGDYISVAGDAFRMCHANGEWRQQAVDMYSRIYRELGIPLLYVDEFSLRIENRCYGKGHGHSVPSNLLKTDREFISQLRDAMPPEVVLYGEYAAVDVNARYIDCNITYHIVDAVTDMIETAWRGGDGDNRLGPVITDIYRFVFPKIVQLVLPMAMRNLSWHPLKFIFFNGEAVYDSFWDCEESRGLEFTVKAYGLKKKYADCFTSDHPSPMVDTMTPAVCANCFPGKGRTVYTLYNRAYSTYRGKVLRIVHEEGTQYYDAWNDRILEPQIKDGFAELSLTLHAQQIGCLEVKREKKGEE